MIVVTKWLVEHFVERQAFVGKGFGIVAQRDFKPGDEVFRASALASVAAKEAVCASCLTSLGTQGLRCSLCKRLWYCSKRCQTLDWKLHHKLSCRNEAVLANADALLLLKVLAKLHSSERTPELELVCEVFLSLPHHLDQRTSEQLHELKVTANLALLCWTRGQTPSSSELQEAMEYLGRFQCNNFEICDDQLFPVAFGVCPVGALLNHACWPNCVALYESPNAASGPSVQVIRALCDIEKGAELTLTYVDAALATRERQMTLMDKYFFICNCDRCMKLAWMDAVLSTHYCQNTKDRPLSTVRIVHLLDELLQGTWNNTSNSNFSTASPWQFACKLEDLNLQEPLHVLNMCSLCGQKIGAETPAFDDIDGCLTRSQHPLLQFSGIALAQQSVEAALESGDFDQAVMPAAWLVICYRFIYGPVHPLLGLQLFTLGKILWNVSQSATAVRVLKQARHTLIVTHGASSPIIMSLTPLLRDAVEESLTMCVNQQK